MVGIDVGAKRSLCSLGSFPNINTQERRCREADDETEPGPMTRFLDAREPRKGDFPYHRLYHPRDGIPTGSGGSTEIAGLTESPLPWAKRDVTGSTAERNRSLQIRSRGFESCRALQRKRLICSRNANQTLLLFEVRSLCTTTGSGNLTISGASR